MIAKRIKRNIKRKVNSISNELFGVSPSDVAYAVSAVKAIGDMAESGELAEPKSVGGATSIYLKQIEEDFPDFHNDDAEVAIKTFVTEYIDIQYNNKKDFTHSKVYKELLPQIKKHSQKSNISNIDFHKISICAYKKSDEYATIEYRASVGYNTNSKRIETRYIIDYSLRLSNNSVATQALICPNCGATIESTSLTNCEYCGTKIIRDTILNWSISSIKEY
jgi:hypothetical protein